MKNDLVCPKCGESKLITISFAVKDKVEYSGLSCDSCGFKVTSEISYDDAEFMWRNAGNNNVLKPCPFCGSTHVETITDESAPADRKEDWWMIICHKCAAEFRSAFYRKKAVIDRWNMRVKE